MSKKKKQLKRLCKMINDAPARKIGDQVWIEVTYDEYGDILDIVFDNLNEMSNQLK